MLARFLANWITLRMNHWFRNQLIANIALTLIWCYTFSVLTIWIAQRTAVRIFATVKLRIPWEACAFRRRWTKSMQARRIAYWCTFVIDIQAVVSIITEANTWQYTISVRTVFAMRNTPSLESIKTLAQPYWKLRTIFSLGTVEFRISIHTWAFVWTNTFAILTGRLANRRTYKSDLGVSRTALVHKFGAYFVLKINLVVNDITVFKTVHVVPVPLTLSNVGLSYFNWLHVGDLNGFTMDTNYDVNLF